MIDIIKHFLGNYFVVPLVLLFGLYLTIKLRGLQFTHFFVGIRKLCSSHSKTTMSPLTALAAVLGGNLGTGNIAGIAVALSLGGPGSLFWMWIMAFFGAIIKFTACFLGVKYRRYHRSKRQYVGGPMYYLLDGAKGRLGKILAVLFCICTVLTAFSVGNIVQVNSVALPLMQIGFTPISISLVMAVLVGIVLLGGAKLFAEVATRLVPLMAMVYVITCLIILLKYASAIIPNLELIIKAAFSPGAIYGGVLGIGVLDAIRVGFDRGLFATDAGVGIAPILHAQVGKEQQTLQEHAVNQGLVSVLAPFIVMSICMLTGLVLLVTNSIEGACGQSTNLCITAFSKGLGFSAAGQLVTITLFLFAFTTILTWAYCAEQALDFIFGDDKKAVFVTKIFKLIFILFIPVGVYLEVKLAWGLADIALNLMLLLNILGIFLLRKKIIV